MVKTMEDTQTDDKAVINDTQQVLQGLRIGSRWAISSDNLNIILYKRNINKKTGDEYWNAEGFFATPQGALMWLVYQEVRDTHLSDLKTVCDKIDQLQKEISQMTFEELKSK